MNSEQLKTILWLRWRLMCNQWKRTRGLGAVFAVLIGIAASSLAALGFAGGFFGGFFGLGDASPMTIMFIWLGVTIAFLFLWTIGLLTELQRSETIDLQKLMHLPVALGQMFVINYLVSHFTLSIIVIVPAMLGLAIGLVFSRGFEMSLLIPLALSMIFMITAWTYCLRGWLATLMTNPRRRRTVIMAITFSFILLSQGPNLYFNVLHRYGRDSSQPVNQTAQKEKFNEFLAAQKFIPPLWLPVGAQAIAGKNPLPALLGMLGCSAIGALGLRRAYRSAIRFYHGETGGQAAAKIKISGEAKKNPTPRAKNKKDFLELSIPFVPEQSAALALATFRSLLRAPEVKMAWASSFISVVILGTLFFMRSPSHLPDAIKPFAATGTIVFSLFLLIQFFVNQFGFDRDGFRTLILSPTERKFILLGKNLASLPVGLVSGGLLLTFAALRLQLPPLTVAATLFQLVGLFLIIAIGGNLASILAPQRITPGSLRPTKAKSEMVILMIVLQLLFLLAMLPVFLPPLFEWLWQKSGWPDFVPVNFIFSALLCAAAIFAYWQLLAPFGRLLQRRETKILNIVTAEVE
jgi:ABC-2 type transport system permease protein